MSVKTLEILPDQDVTPTPYFDVYEDGVWQGSRRFTCKAHAMFSGTVVINPCDCELMEGNYLCVQNSF